MTADHDVHDFAELPFGDRFFCVGNLGVEPLRIADGEFDTFVV